MTSVSIRDDRLIVNVEGLRRVWALKRGFDIPLEHVCGVTADPAISRTRKGIRAPGTYLPGVITAGTYYRFGERHFWDVRRPENVIVIELRNERYKRLIVEVADPAKAVATIERAVTDAPGDLT
ncbi:MAG: hypothetical protein L0K86_12275 [Actinomycetia bacterium]|nr:hypothetical protein [Actinomycetes bacterium]